VDLLPNIVGIGGVIGSRDDAGEDKGGKSYGQ